MIIPHMGKIYPLGVKFAPGDNLERFGGKYAFNNTNSNCQIEIVEPGGQELEDAKRVANQMKNVAINWSISRLEAK